MTAITTTTIQGVVGSGCDGVHCSTLFVITMWHQEKTSRPRHGREFCPSKIIPLR